MVSDEKIGDSKRNIKVSPKQILGFGFGVKNSMDSDKNIEIFDEIGSPMMMNFFPNFNKPELSLLNVVFLDCLN